MLYFVVCGGCLLNKIYNYEFQNGILKILTLPIFLLWSCTELARVALGYIGADHIGGSLSQGAGAAGQVEGANNALLPQAGHPGRDRIFKFFQVRLGVTFSGCPGCPGLIFP